VDLNIMARRDLFHTRVQRIKPMTPQTFSMTGVHLIFVEAGELTVRSEHRTETLMPHDVLLLDAREDTAMIAPADATMIISIEIISNEHRMH
jgi:environmental stress-induced protein Ves